LFLLCLSFEDFFHYAYWCAWFYKMIKGWQFLLIMELLSILQLKNVATFDGVVANGVLWTSFPLVKAWDTLLQRIDMAVSILAMGFIFRLWYKLIVEMQKRQIQLTFESRVSRSFGNKNGKRGGRIRHKTLRTRHSQNSRRATFHYLLVSFLLF
jgi:hypothetical protein